MCPLFLGDMLIVKSKTARKVYFERVATSPQEPFSILHRDFASTGSHLLAALQVLWTNTKKKSTTLLLVMNRVSWNQRVLNLNRNIRFAHFQLEDFGVLLRI